MTDLISWIDVETSGLDAREDSLLEIACLMTDTELNILDEDGFSEVVLYSPDQVDLIKSTVSPLVREMHEKSGLWNELPLGTPLQQVDEDLYEYISSFAPIPRSVRVSGNSVRLDLNFIEQKLPTSYRHLHYRVIDVTTVASLAHWWKDIPIFSKNNEHRAMGDIKESIAELKYLREQLKM